jgi:hypothetical protein
MMMMRLSKLVMVGQRSGGISSLIYCFNLRPHGTSSFPVLIIAKMPDDDDIVKTGYGGAQIRRRFFPHLLLESSSSWFVFFSGSDNGEDA